MSKRTTDEASDLEWFLSEIRRINGCERTKEAILGVVKAQAGKVIRFTRRDLVRPTQVIRARQLLDAGNSRATTRDRLRSELGCSTRQAYNLISEAIHSRH